MTSPQAPASEPTILRHPGCRPQLVERLAGRPIGRAHFVGICGAGMKALAEMASGLGWRVSGSDAGGPAERLRGMRRRGWRVHRGHQDRFVPQDADVLVYSPAVGPSNPERLAAEQLGIPQYSYSGMLGHLMQSRTGVAVAGTHGKSTTTAMTAAILDAAGLDPSAVIGAELRGGGPRPGGTCGWAGGGELFVVESCEYRKSFLDVRPRYAVITGIEPDHFDCYETFVDTKAAFAQFAGQVEPDGSLLIRAECDASREAAAAARCEVVTLSLREGADWWAADIKRHAGGLRFRVFRHGWYFAEVALQLPGLHNVENALAAAALAHAAGAEAADVREALAEFTGVRRRFEHVGSWRGVTLIDDYAHHPTAVRATLQTAREIAGRRRIVCVFQPHQVSRTVALMDEFAQSFEAADRVIVAPVFAAREQVTDEPAVTARELADRIAAAGQSAGYQPDLDRIVATLDDNLRPGDVLVTMGAGDIDRVHQELTRAVQPHHAAG
jgi:UDP-N-acetylmuramate--alanine ligase